MPVARLNVARHDGDRVPIGRPANDDDRMRRMADDLDAGDHHFSAISPNTITIDAISISDFKICLVFIALPFD